MFQTNVVDKMSKNVVETDGPQMASKYGAYALDKQSYMHVSTSTRPRARVPTSTHAHTDQ
jgi:hypothetical protein